MTAVRSAGRSLAPWVLVLAMALLAVGTISNQVRINTANTKLRAQAENGQKSLNRQCRVLPISLKLYADALQRGKITVADYAEVASTGDTTCAPSRPR